jgi:hypothetical protein
MEDALAMLADTERSDEEAKKHTLRNLKRIAFEGLLDYGRKTATEQIMEQEIAQQTEQPASSSSAPPMQPASLSSALAEPTEFSGFSKFAHFLPFRSFDDAKKYSNKFTLDFLKLQSQLRSLPYDKLSKHVLLYNIVKFDHKPENQNFKPSSEVFKKLTFADIENWKTGHGILAKMHKI